MPIIKLDSPTALIGFPSRLQQDAGGTRNPGNDPCAAREEAEKRLRRNVSFTSRGGSRDPGIDGPESPRDPTRTAAL